MFNRKNNLEVKAEIEEYETSSKLPPVKSDLEASPEKAEEMVSYALQRYDSMGTGEKRGDMKFVEILSVKTFLDKVVEGYMGSISQDQLEALAKVNDAIVGETQTTAQAIQGENMQEYIANMSGLVGLSCEAVGLATKVQCAKNGDFEGYKAELSDKALEMLDMAKKQYLGSGNSRSR